MKKVNGNLIFEVKISVDIKKFEDNCVERFMQELSEILANKLYADTDNASIQTNVSLKHNGLTIIDLEDSEVENE